MPSESIGSYYDSTNVAIHCKSNPETSERNFAYGKDYGGIIYCLEDCCKNQNNCVFKKV